MTQFPYIKYSPSCKGRGVRLAYFDLGANWANTLRLFQDISGCDPTDGRWEIYAWEAHPLITPYVDRFVDWLNGVGIRPRMDIIPSGSTPDMINFAERHGCAPTLTAGLTGPEMHLIMKRVAECLSASKRIKSALRKLKVDRALASKDLVSNRLAMAAKPHRNDAGPYTVRRQRFTLIPAAAGTKNGTLEFAFTRFGLLKGVGAPNESTGRSNLKSSKDQRQSISQTESARALVFDFPEWFAAWFEAHDYIVVKMDIEGFEFAVIQKMIDLGVICHIDVLAWQCHGHSAPAGVSCGTLYRRIKDMCPHILVLSENSRKEGDSKYDGFDRASKTELLHYGPY